MTRTWRLLLALLAAFSLVAAACGDADDDADPVIEVGDDADDVDTEATDVPGDVDTVTETETAVDSGTATEAAGTESGEAMDGSDVEVGLVYDIGGRGDLSFNDAAAAGLDRAIADFGVDATELEPSSGGEDRDESLALLSEQGNDVVFAVGFLFQDAVEASSEENPDVNFGLIDSVVEADNVASLVFAEEQGSFLVGALAALTSETGRIGFIGGVDFELIQRFEAGYEAGARAVDPDVEIDIDYVSQPPDFDGFNQPDVAQEIALSQYQSGVDVIYHAAGGAGNGLFEAARTYSENNDTQVWAIGVDSDQYLTVSPDLQPYVLSSMLKRVDVAVYETIRSLVEGDFASGVSVFDLSVDGVGYSTTGDNISGEVIDQLEDLKAQIVAGEIEVPSSPERLEG